MTTDVVLSMFAGDRIPAGALFVHPPRVVQWVPPPSSPGAHPSWTGEADKLRQGAYRKGPLLPSLLRRYGMKWEDVGRIAVLGFSAGSNNGVRECLRSEDDRRRIDVVIAVDGLHPTLASSPGNPPRGNYAAWSQELEPFAAFGERAALGAGAMVATASQVAAPTKTNGQTARVLVDLTSDVIARTEGQELGPRTLPDDFPTSRDPVVPIERGDVGGFCALWYAGNDKTAHILQGKAVVRDLWRDVLSRRWSPETIPELVDYVPPTAATASSAPVVRGRAAAVVVPALSALAAVGGVFLTR